VRGDLDDVVGGVGMGLGEVGDHHFVDARHFRVAALATRFYKFAEGCMSRLQIMFEPQHLLGYFSRLRPCQPHHSNASAPRRRSDGDDGVVEIHRAIVAVTLEDNQASGD